MLTLGSIAQNNIKTFAPKGNVLYAVTNASVVIKSSDGVTWTTITPAFTPAIANFNAISVNSESNILATFDNGVLYQYNGTSWVNQSAALKPSALNGIYASSSTDDYAV